MRYSKDLTHSELEAVFTPKQGVTTDLPVAPVDDVALFDPRSAVRDLVGVDRHFGVLVGFQRE